MPTAAAGTYKFTFALETGETYSANLVVNVIEKSRSLKDGNFNKLATEKTVRAEYFVAIDRMFKR